MYTEVLVIGGGPAGVMAAITADLCLREQVMPRQLETQKLRAVLKENGVVLG